MKKRKWWIILVIVIGLFVGLVAFANKDDTFEWPNMTITKTVPEPETNKGKINSNGNDFFYIDIHEQSFDNYEEYLTKCKNKGYTIDAVENDDSYEAYNKDGLKLDLNYYDSTKEMSIYIYSPIKLGALQWPSTGLATYLPNITSTVGKINYDTSTQFSATVGDMSFDAYKDYVEACISKGFNVDYDKYEKAYRASNSQGYKINVEYLGFNIVAISINQPKEEGGENSKPTETSNPAQANNTLGTDFKKAMDSYEKFMDEYVAFMKKYSANPTDMSLLKDYTEYMNKYSTFCADFAKWENEELNDAELNYYIEVQTRVNQKLLEVAF